MLCMLFEMVLYEMMKGLGTCVGFNKLNCSIEVRVILHRKNIPRRFRRFEQISQIEVAGSSVRSDPFLKASAFILSFSFQYFELAVIADLSRLRRLVTAIVRGRINLHISTLASNSFLFHSWPLSAPVTAVSGQASVPG